MTGAPATGLPAGTAPAGTAPAGTAPAGTAPAGTAPAGTAPPGDPADAGRAAGLSADQIDALFVLGYSFIQHRQTDKAMTLFEAMQTLLPDDTHVRLSLSYVYLSARQYAPALALADAALAAFGAAGQDEAAIALLQSRALWGLERIDEARAHLRQFTSTLEVTP